tara:strand:+ start:22265 stop:22618 length:354 start_codon:yes stop_codon:yes gene_type:complete
MARAFRCKSCGIGYSTTGDDVPPSPNWADGHVCEMVEVESKIKTNTTPSGVSEEEKDNLQNKNNLGPFESSRMDVDVMKSFDAEKDPDFTEEDKLELKRNARLKIIGQNGNTGEHYE